jgi:hypothetical protein
MPEAGFGAGRRGLCAVKVKLTISFASEALLVKVLLL